MTRLGPTFTATIITLAFVTSAPAQVTVDMAKITCNQLLLEKITNSQNIVLWLSGYYHAKRNDTLVETQKLAADAQKIRECCLHKPDVTVMQAIETAAPKQ